ncbi:Hint domain-containing protein [Szabonella alba]|uniref:Hint domain-containing protein n=1 Tax=Szabonella alba TaxID=2804194 RepID=A0A8K0Y1Y5_9RHOB|nr:Hint domain-containing protein [Szabonella alba]MBL4916564.1 Hint domain-containing protein [Szabonella alba]
MPTNYSFTFYVVDPGNPPGSNTQLNPMTLNVVDQNDDGFLRGTGGDRIAGYTITDVWVGDTITVRNTSGGPTYTITGVTYYIAGGPALFMATDGTNLQSVRFRSSTFVNESTEYQVGAVPCFTAGTRIESASGPVAVEDLQAGDLIVTRDNGLQPLRWLGCTTVPAQGEHAPIRFAPGVLGNRRALLVSPNHRMLVEGWRAELFFGEAEVLVAAKHLLNGDTIRRVERTRITYLHLLFDRHEIVFAEGAASESLHPGEIILQGDSATAREILALFPELASRDGLTDRRTARVIPTAREAQILCAA